MSVNLSKLVARISIPQTDSLVPTPARDGAPIRTESNAQDRRRMSPDCAHKFYSIRVPHADCRVHTTAGERAPVRTERHAADRTSVTGERS